MARIEPSWDRISASLRRRAPLAIFCLVLVLAFTAYFVYSQFRIDVPSKHIAVLIRKTGEDIPNGIKITDGLGHLPPLDQ